MWRENDTRTAWGGLRQRPQSHTARAGASHGTLPHLAAAGGVCSAPASGSPALVLHVEGIPTPLWTGDGMPEIGPPQRQTLVERPGFFDLPAPYRSLEEFSGGEAAEIPEHLLFFCRR